MQIIPPDFPEEITFSYLLNKSWNIYCDNFLKMTLFSILYILVSLPFAFIPILGTVIGHIFFFGVIFSMNNFRLKAEFKYADLFWGFAEFKRLKEIIIISLPFIPLIIISALLFHYLEFFNQEYKVIILIIGILLGTVLILLLILASFVFVIENEAPLKTFKRAQQLLFENISDVLLILVWILILNLVGLISILGILITGPLSALIMLDMCRFLIRKYELKDLMI